LYYRYDTVFSGRWLLTFRKKSVTIFSVQGDVICPSETSASSARTRLHPLPSEFPVGWRACRSSA